MQSKLSVHIPVMPREVIHGLNLQPGATVVDGTFGGGGHARLLAERVGSTGRLIALDRDLAAVERAADHEITCLHANFRNLLAALDSVGVDQVDGILLDLGLSSDQLADRGRGFSFQAEGDLDLRFDPGRGEPAWSLLARLPERELAKLIFELGEERLSRRIARRIVTTRREHPIRRSEQLAAMIQSCVPRAKNHSIHPATRTFQALRIAVNDELGALRQALEDAPRCLRPGGRLAVISFHSLEDRMVKHAFRDDDRYVILTKKPIRPNQDEQDANIRSRSARLRVAERSPA